MNHIGTQTIETGRLILRRFREDDAEAQFENWANDPEVTRFLHWEAHKTVDESRAAIARRLEKYGKPDAYMWAITSKDGALMGAISAHIESETDSIAMAGYCLGRAFWGKGYMTEALKAVLEYMFLRVGVNRIEAVHAVENPASGAVMRKAGMLREGRLRQAYRNHAGYHDGELYGLVREDWDIRREMDFYNALPVDFRDFIEPGELSDGEISLALSKKSPAIPEKKWVPSYEFDIVKDGAKVGHIGLRIGYTDGLYYGGQIGYGVDEACRGRGYAGRACALLKPVLRAHGMRIALITNDVNNLASRRVCEKLGARHVRAATLPDWHDLYAEGHRAENIYEWAIDEPGDEIRREMDRYAVLPARFDGFIEPGLLTDGTVELVCTLKTPANPEKKWAPSYTFEIRADGARVGEANLRIGFSDGLYYGGHIGYHMDEGRKGRGYAGRACALLTSVMRAHGMTAALISNDVKNAASRRVCEKLGARLIRTARVPEPHDLYAAGLRWVNIYEWNFGG